MHCIALMHRQATTILACVSVFLRHNFRILFIKLCRNIISMCETSFYFHKKFNDFNCIVCWAEMIWSLSVLLQPLSICFVCGFYLCEMCVLLCIVIADVGHGFSINWKCASGNHLSKLGNNRFNYSQRSYIIWSVLETKCWKIQWIFKVVSALTNGHCFVSLILLYLFWR